MGYRIEVFDKNLNRVGEIDQWISLDFTVRFCQAGIWQLLVKDQTPQAALIQKGGGIVIWQDGAPEPLLSGQVDTFQKYWTTQQHTGPGSVYIAGKCHNQLAYNRLAFTSTGRTVSRQYLGPTSRNVSGPAGALIWNELNASLGPGAVTDRRIPRLNVGSSVSIGDTVTDSLRYEVIGDKLEQWTSDKGNGYATGYRMLYNPQTQAVDLKVYKPRDRSKTVRFSTDLGNLREYVYTLNAPQVTRAIVACQGEGKDRYVWQKVDTASEAEWGISVESFVDRRDIPLKTASTGAPQLVTKTDSDGIEDIGLDPNGNDWTTELARARAAYEAAKQKDPNGNHDVEYDAVVYAVKAAKPVAVAYYMDVIEEAADAVLTDGEKRGNFQVYPIDTEGCKFGIHYFVGDVITVSVDGVEYTDIVREVTISVDDGGNTQDVAPKIGQQGSGEPLNLYKTVSEMQRKLRRLESRM
ncbi:siphovirus ReqiPepy6 Gp37-like family protein [Streptomyces sp. PsTaAH-124]|uniref:siphovirus ReqiPepy6 Gp37-like family protein n=1 Tax=Streptomyces sp. PsTaAH-124 TaxID=1157638 RepID=UPI000567397D|nr:siphovirus ReqiPepy6 Gp37-like family protein [Streptomyces sp. PsTaAH-124]